MLKPKAAQDWRILKEMLENTYGDGPYIFQSMREFEALVCNVAGIKRASFYERLADARAQGALIVDNDIRVSFDADLLT